MQGEARDLYDPLCATMALREYVMLLDGLVAKVRAWELDRVGALDALVMLHHATGRDLAGGFCKALEIARPPGSGEQ